MVDGKRHSPLGYAPKFVFRIDTLHFVLKVYIVDSANYQLLLGTSFMHEVGAGLFPKWRTVVLTILLRISIHASTDAIQRANCPPLNDEASAASLEVQRLRHEYSVPVDEVVPLENPMVFRDPAGVREPLRVLFIGGVPPSSTLPFLSINCSVRSTYQLGLRDLVRQVESVTLDSVDSTFPVLTCAFVASTIDFSDEVPDHVKQAVCQDVIDYSHVFSWNAFDLGCITDIPYRVIRLDHSPAVQPSRPYLYTPFNDSVLHAKCDPLIHLGIFFPAPPECQDRTQLTIVRTAPTAKDRHDPRYCRIAHDFRVLNDKIQADPEPVDSVVDMLAWIGDSSTGLFFKTDADRGFYQIVCADSESVNSTCFELFHQLWVSSRMLFGQKNGPATFKRNAVMMQEELLQSKKTKSYFDDILGKASTFDDLRAIWVRLLQLAASHGWKFKPAKTRWGFSTIETVGFEWSPHGIGIGKKNRNAVRSLVFPRTKSELRGLLGLANQFRERIAGYALIMTALTALTRGPEKKVVATPEALVEFEDLKVALNSPPVLQQFRYDRPTFVYTDASLGSVLPDDTIVPGGLGVVIVHTDPDGSDYVCAYASAGLSAAQKNYHIVRLELLAFVFACGKFHDWLAGISYVWRSDCRAHEFLNKARLSTNPTIARYALALSEFDFRVEWVPGTKMIADPFSRLVLLSGVGREESISLPEVVFGISIGGRIAASRSRSAAFRSVTPLDHPLQFIAVRQPWVIEVDDEDLGWCWLDAVALAYVAPHAGDISLAVLSDVPFCAADPVVPDDTPELEELPDWPQLTHKETSHLQAIRRLRDWVSSTSADRSQFPVWMHPILSTMAHRVRIIDGILFKDVRQGMGGPLRLEVLDTPARLREVLLMCHEGMGHRQLRSIYKYFCSRYWVPAAAKLIKRHLMACKTCQCFANARVNSIRSPGYSPRASDVFTHWSVDFAGPFPKDAETGMEYVIIAVEWITRWAEAEATPAASPETAANFLYSRIVCRYGCIESLQSDNGPHFINPIVRCLTRLLQIRHHLSTPYYPQNNGRVERVVGTLKAMLRRTVAAASSVAPSSLVDDSINVYGVDLTLDEHILDAIRSAKEPAPDIIDEEDAVPVPAARVVHWSPLLYTVLWVYRATPHSATGMSAALLALGRELRLPMDASHPSPPPSVTDAAHKELILKRLQWVSDTVPGLRALQAPAAEVTTPPRFQLGQKVWKRESKYDGKGFVPVFAPRWTGPFVIHSVYDKGAYKLRTLPSDGKRSGYLRNPVNATRLKPYVDGEVLV